MQQTLSGIAPNAIQLRGVALTKVTPCASGPATKRQQNHKHNQKAALMRVCVCLAPSHANRVCQPTALAAANTPKTQTYLSPLYCSMRVAAQAGISYTKISGRLRVAPGAGCAAAGGGTK